MMNTRRVFSAIAILWVVSVFFLWLLWESQTVLPPPQKLDKRTNMGWLDEDTASDIMLALQDQKFDYEDFKAHLKKRGIIFTSEKRKPLAPFTLLLFSVPERGYYFYFPTPTPARYNTLLIETGGSYIHFGKRPIGRVALAQECQWTLFRTDEACMIQMIAPIPREADGSNDASDNEPVCASVRDALIEKYFVDKNSHKKGTDTNQIYFPGTIAHNPNYKEPKNTRINNEKNRIDSLDLTRMILNTQNSSINSLMIVGHYTLSVCSSTYRAKSKK